MNESSYITECMSSRSLRLNIMLWMTINKIMPFVIG
nr:MAG TPA: hypothetical protein [Caudoviricetes sp.]